MTFWKNHVVKLLMEFDGQNLNLSNGKLRDTIGHLDQRYTKLLYEELQHDKNFEKIIDPDFGNPRRFLGYSMGTLRCLKYMNHISKLGNLDEIDTVVDFGSGYGNFCRVWKLLYPNVRYYNVDLKEMFEMQRLYIENTVTDRSRIDYITHEQLDTVHKKNKSLFLAAYSLSECTEKIRDEVEVNLTKFDYVFIIHNSKFPVEENNEIDNVLYFQQLKDRMSYRNYQCVHEMDEQSGKWWLTCKKM